MRGGFLRMRRGRAAAVVAGVLAALVAALWAELRGGRTDSLAPSRGMVRRVVDGDTFHLTNGATVRLLEIDAPELDGPLAGLARAATEELRGLVERREVRLEPGPRQRDVYGRFLAYVFVVPRVATGAEDTGRPAGPVAAAPGERSAAEAELFVNAELVRRGLARARTWGAPGARFDELVRAEREAREARRGLWE